MAQTRRKRQTKHRGNAAGIVESRGRTGRKPTAAEKRGETRAGDRAKRREDRYDKPPTWKGTFYRALAGAIVVAAMLLLLNKKSPATAFVGFFVVLVAYIPIIYYMDTWLHRRKMRAKAAQSEKAAQR